MTLHDTPAGSTPARTARAVRGLALVGTTALALTLTGCGDEPAPTTRATVTVTESPSPTTTPPADTSTATSTDTSTVTSPPTDEASTQASTPSDDAAQTAGTGALPAGAAPYADGLVVAWGSGNRAEALRYATPEVLTTLFGAHSPGGPHWDRVGVEGAAGSVYVTYRDTGTGETLELGVLNEAASTGTEHAVTRAQFPG